MKELIFSPFLINNSWRISNCLEFSFVDVCLVRKSAAIFPDRIVELIEVEIYCLDYKHQYFFSKLNRIRLHLKLYWQLEGVRFLRSPHRLGKHYNVSSTEAKTPV